MSSSRFSKARQACFALALAVTLAPSLATSSEPEGTAMSCPESIAVEQRAIGPAPGWSARSTEVPHRLRQVTLYWGHPSRRASLVPDEEQARAGGTVGVVWKLGQGTERYWLECAYRNTDVVLFREVPARATRCEFVTDPKLLLDGTAALVSTRCE